MKRKILLLLLIVFPFVVFSQTTATGTTDQSNEIMDLLGSVWPYLSAIIVLVLDHIVAKSKSKKNSILELIISLLQKTGSKKK